MTEKKSFKGKLGNYSYVETSDGSLTLHSDFFDENFHNLKGAYEETLYTYIDGSKLSRIFENETHRPNSFSILEVGFGMGLGLYALDRFVSEQNSSKLKSHVQLNFISFEIDRELILWQRENDQRSENLYSPSLIPTLAHWQTKTFKILQEEFEYLEISLDLSEKISFTGILLLGDGRKVLPAWMKHCEAISFPWPKFQAVFQDAFSPKKNPDLWTVEWFTDILKHSSQDVILSTYSSATAIRRSLYEAGWCIYHQKGFAHKKSMTIATANEEIFGKMEPDLKAKIQNTPIPPYRDRDQKEFMNQRDQKIKENT